MADSSHYKAHYTGYLYTAVGVVRELGSCLSEGLDSRFRDFLTRPHYCDLSYLQLAMERLQSCKSDHTPRRHVMITFPHP